MSGLRVSNSKTEGLWIGSLKDNPMKPLGIKWPDEPIKALGVFLTYDQNVLHEKYLKEKRISFPKLSLSGYPHNCSEVRIEFAIS